MMLGTKHTSDLNPVSLIFSRGTMQAENILQPISRNRLCDYASLHECRCSANHSSRNDTMGGLEGYN